MFVASAGTGAAARRERNRQDMQAAILEAARTVVTEQGINALTIRVIAKALGYSPGAIYEYFDSKEAILTALYFHGATGLGGALERTIAELPPGTSAVDAIVALGHAYRAFALDHAELYRLVFGGFEHPPQPPPVDDPEDNAGGFGTLVRAAQRGIDEDAMVDLPAPVIACAAWSAVHGFVSLELSGHVTGSDAPGMPPPSPEEGRQRRDRLFAAVVRMAILGLVNEEGRAAISRF